MPPLGEKRLLLFGSANIIKKKRMTLGVIHLHIQGAARLPRNFFTCIQMINAAVGVRHFGVVCNFGWMMSRNDEVFFLNAWNVPESDPNEGPSSLKRDDFFCDVFWDQRRRTNKSVKTLDQSLGPHVCFSNCCLSWRYLLQFSFTNFSTSWMTRFVLMSCFLIFLVCWLSSFCSCGVFLVKKNS